MTRVGLSAATDTTMAFDAFDRVRVVDEPGSGLTQHRYDAAGERATTVWADGRIERYFEGGLTQRQGRLELHVGLGGARVVARVNVPELPDGTPSISDGLGGAPAVVYLHQGVGHGPTVVTDASGAVIEERVFEPYGTPLWVDADYELERLGYNGKAVDPSTGWSDHGARWHATRFARWLSVDPPLKGPGGLVEHGLIATPYGFVAGNPVMFWDPDGRLKETPEILRAALAGAAAAGGATVAGGSAAAGTAAGAAGGATLGLGIGLAVGIGIATVVIVYHYGEGALFGHEPVPTRNPNQGDEYEADVRDTPFYIEPELAEPGPVDDGPSEGFLNALGDRGTYDGQRVTEIGSQGDGVTLISDDGEIYIVKRRRVAWDSSQASSEPESPKSRFTVKDAEKAYRTDKNFKSYFHWKYKQADKMGNSSYQRNSDLGEQEKLEAFIEWKELGEPRR